MLHEIRVKKEFNYSHLESDVFKKISKEKFFAELQDSNINMYYLITNAKKDLNYVAKFNFFLRVVKQNHQIGIYESLIYLEDESYEFKKTIPLLDSSMRSELENELGEKFKLKKKAISAFIDNYFIY